MNHEIAASIHNEILLDYEKENNLYGIGGIVLRESKSKDKHQMIFAHMQSIKKQRKGLDNHQGKQILKYDG